MIVKTRTMRWPVFAVIPFALSRDLRGIGGVLMKKWFIFLVCLWAFQASAQTTYPAASCSQSAVSAAIAAEQVHPVDGDVIAIPAGNCTWSSGLSVTFPNSVTIQGAGAISATTGGASTTGTDQTVILNHTATYPATGNLFVISTTAGKSFRFTGIALTQDGSSPSTTGTLSIYGTSTAVRVDHCHLQLAVGGTSTSLFVGGSVQGVADHDYFDDANLSITNDIAFHNGVGWNGSNESGNAIGDHSWSDTEHWGSSKFFFVEDSRFSGGDVSDAHDGARYVMRHCTVTGSNSEQFFNHGLTNSRARATRAAEIYSNTFTNTGNNGNPPYSLNSGTLLFWGNTVTGGYRSAVEIGYSFRTTAGGGGNYNYTGNWGYCGVAAGGPTNWDGNLNSTGLACIDQPGRGSGDLLTGDFPPNGSGVINTKTGTVGWPHQALSPIYVWNNTYTPQYFTSSPLVSEGCNGVCSDNREYYQQFGSLAEPGSFNGTKGVGQGLLSARPATCTAGTDPLTSGNAPGVGYWATDTNTLYVCNPTNTWTVYYTPYTYPHPLVAGGTTGTGVSPPTSLAATVQ
jgi:hypothetical protein